MLLKLLLESFSGKELSHFGSFISNKYFNTDQFVIKLLHSLEKKVLNRQVFDDAIQREVYVNIFQKEVAKERLDAAQKRRLHSKISALTRLAKKFLVVESIEEHTVVYTELLQKALLKKEQYKLAERHLNKIRKSISQSSFKDITYYDSAFQVEKATFNLLSQKGQLKKEDNLATSIHYLDMQFLLNKLKLHSTALSLARISKKKTYDFSKLIAIEPFLQASEYKNNTLVKIYSIVIELMEKDEEKDYLRLLDVLDKCQLEIPSHYLKDFYIAAANFCVHKIVKGIIGYNQHLYELYKIMDEKKLLLENGKISTIRLRNIVGLSCRQGDFDWARQLTYKYYQLVKDRDVPTALHFNLGIIAFYQKHYKEAIQHFIHIDNSNINCRILILKSYYELDKEYDERTMTIFRTTEQFVKKHKSLSTIHRRGYRNFIRILINLYRLHHNTGKITKENILKKMEQMNFISDKKWLLEKLNGSCLN